MAAQVPPRLIKRILIANRGEIATRIISSCRELSLETIALYTENDVSHTFNASHAIRLESPSAYVNVEALVRIARENHVDALHPGYGFLSESPLLASRMAEINVLVVGPGAENLERTGDKLSAKKLAEECRVPTLPALTTPSGDVGEVEKFAKAEGLPIMVKAVDGGGGRGIRLVRRMEDLKGLTKRAIEESPSKKVFAEKAAVDGFRHVEVQIVGDGKGNVMHLWERECSIQRRYQKIVELAPSTIEDRSVVAPVIEAAVRMAKHVSTRLFDTIESLNLPVQVNYASLGTFEFLLNPQTRDYYFLEINPRLQVEHTITESICSVDIVKAQLRLAQGVTFAEAGLAELSQDPLKPPQQYSIQLRLTAEDPERDYSLSIGKIRSIHFPSGVGTRVDTALVPGFPTTVTSDFDSVIAKVIVTARTWSDVVSKAIRALEDTSVQGIQTNLALLRAILSHQTFHSGACDTQWLEAQHKPLLTLSRKFKNPRDPFHGLIPSTTSFTSASNPSSPSLSGPLFSKDDAWTLTLQSPSSSSSSSSSPDQAQQTKHHLQLTRLLKSDFPSSLSAEILYTTPSSPSPQPFTLHLSSTTASSSAATSNVRRGDPSDPSHVILPLSGKLVEVLVDEGDMVGKDEAICVVRQMKMEIEVRSSRKGRVSWVIEVEDGEDVAEGMLAAVVVVEEEEEEEVGREEKARL